VFDRPPQTTRRYLGKKPATRPHHLALQQQGARNAARRTLRVETLAKALVRTFRRRACDAATVWTSRSTGPTTGPTSTAGRAPISSFASSDGRCRHVRRTIPMTGGSGSSRSPVIRHRLTDRPHGALACACACEGQTGATRPTRVGVFEARTRVVPLSDSIDLITVGTI
jgi:hypothetical protein